MQTKHLCVLIHIWTKGEVGAPLNRFKPSSKVFYWPFQGDASFVDHLCYFWHVLLCIRARLFVDALKSHAVKGLTSWLSIVMSNCDVVTFPLVSWVRCGAWLYWSWSLPSSLLSAACNQSDQVLSNSTHVNHRRKGVKTPLFYALELLIEWNESQWLLTVTI